MAKRTTQKETIIEPNFAFLKPESLEDLIPNSAFNAVGIMNNKYVSRARKTKTPETKTTYAAWGCLNAIINPGSANKCSVLYVPENKQLFGFFEGSIDGIKPDPDITFLSEDREIPMEQAKEKIRAYMIDFAKQTFHGQLYDGQILKMLLAWNRYDTPDSEVDSLFRKVKRESGFIDSDQTKIVYTAADSLAVYSEQFEKWQWHSEGEDFAETAEALLDRLGDKIELVRFLSADVHPVFEAIPENRITMAVPEDREQNTKKRINPKDALYNGVDTFSASVRNSWPLDMQASYAANRKLFLESRDQLTMKEWTRLYAIMNGKITSLLLEGDAGVGKSTAVKIMAGCLGYPIITLTGSRGVTDVDLFGSTGLEEMNGASITKWVDGPATRAVRNGVFLQLDEVNMIDPTTLAKFNGVLDDTKGLMLASASTAAEWLPVPATFRFVATMNRDAQGTHELNYAFEDRCHKERIADMSCDKKVELISKKTGITNKTVLEKMVRIGDKARRLMADAGLEYKPSIRRLMEWAEMAEISGDYCESALESMIYHIADADPDSDQNAVTQAEMIEGGGIAAVIMEAVQDEFMDEDWND